jgi:hypothetical protein
MASGSIIVTARDFTTGLQGRATGSLLANQSAIVDVRLTPSGRIAGTIYNRDGVTPVGAGVNVALSGQTSLTTRTDALGQYALDFVPLGNFTVEASDNNGNRGRTTSSLTATSQSAVADVSFLGRGTVGGTIRNAANASVPNATVTMTSRSIFGGTRSTTSDAQGRYTFADVFIGSYDVAARAPVARLGGSAGGAIDRDAQNVTTDITLAAAGTLTGTVFRANGTTPVSGAEVRLTPTGLTATTDTQGRYRIELVPVGTYTLDVTDTATGDRGRSVGNVPGQDETGTANVTLNGQGTVIVTVRDGAGNTVSGAQITVSSRTSFGGSQTATTNANGIASFIRVLTGGFDVAAFDPATRLRGSAEGQVATGASTNVALQLQSFGAITGTVFAG